MARLSRRDLLRVGAGALGAGSISGCLAGGRFNRFLLRGASLPAALDASISLKVTDIPTLDRPVGIRAEFTNEADRQRAYRIAHRGWFPLGPDTAADQTAERSSPDRLVLSRAGEDDRLVDGCWKQVPTRSYDDPDGGEWVRLDPGETVEGQRVLLNHERNRACYPPGTYRFGERFWVRRPDADDERGPFEWSLTVSIFESGVGTPETTTG